jgi:uncharacterized protein YsxB (DUF464 family)
MITIRLNQAQIEVSGHAGYAERGKDIVCSAVSILVQTAEEFLSHDRIADVSTITRTTDSKHPRHLAEKLHFNFLKTGLILIKVSYPEYIRIEELK